MRTYRNSTAGIGLAALGALGLTALATPSFAQTIRWTETWNGDASTYAQQAIANAQVGGGLALPAGLQFSTNPFTAPNSANGKVLIDIQLPNGYTLASCPSNSSVAASGTGFVGPHASDVSCYNAGNAPFPNFNQTNGDVIQVTVPLVSGTATGLTGTITFGQIYLASSSTGLANLNPAGSLTNNPDKATTYCLNANINPKACEIFAYVVQASSQTLAAQTTNLSIVMAYSKNAKGVYTLGPTGYTSICVDMLYPYAPGNEFQENCESAYSPPDPDGHFTYHTTSVADKGMIVLDLLALEAQDPGPSDQVLFRETDPTATITMTGTCGGLQLENIGSVAASCGVTPFTGENVYLIPIGGQPGGSAITSNDPVPTPTPACPPPDQSAGAGHPPSGTVAYLGSVSGSTATFTGVPEPTFGSYNTPDGTDFLAYYEVCDYATETAVIADSANWYVTAAFDCAATPQPADCTKTNEFAQAGHSKDLLLPIQYNGKATYINFTNGGFSEQAFLRIVNRMPDVTAYTGNSQETVNQTCVNDSTIGSSGAAGFSTGGANVPNSFSSPPVEGTGNFSNDGTRAVEVVPGLTGDNTGLLDKDLNCQPVAQVVCKVTTDDGFNGYATLFTNNSADPFKGAPGLLSGTNAFYPVYKIFQLAGVPWFTDGYNGFNYASMVCYAPKDVTITHVEQDYNHPLVNMQ